MNGFYPPPPCMICKQRATRVAIDGERCRRMLARLDLELKRAPELDRTTLETLLRARSRVLLVQSMRACATCGEKTEIWVYSLTSPSSGVLVDESDVF